jgi:anthranilate phosphoribosyltransferase
MDSIKTFNISTAASVVAAADGIKMAKHGARAITSKCGAVDILEALGVDVECDASLVKRSIERAGIGIFNGMSGKIHPQALYRILSQIRFGTIFSIRFSSNTIADAWRSWRLSPDMVTSSKGHGDRLQRALVVHGRSADGRRGMDEISALAIQVAELDENGEIREFTLSTGDLDIQRRTNQPSYDCRQ